MVVRSRKRRVIAQSTCSSQKVRSATSFLVRVGVNLSQEMSTSKCRRVLRAGTQCSNHCHADFCQFNVFTFCKATYRDRDDDGASNTDWQTATPADVAGIAEIGDIKPVWESCAAWPSSQLALRSHAAVHALLLAIRMDGSGAPSMRSSRSTRHGHRQPQSPQFFRVGAVRPGWTGWRAALLHVRGLSYDTSGSPEWSSSFAAGVDSQHLRVDAPLLQYHVLLGCAMLAALERRTIRWSATRSACAAIVSAGFTAVDEGKNELSTT